MILRVDTTIGTFYLQGEDYSNGWIFKGGIFEEDLPVVAIQLLSFWDDTLQAFAGRVYVDEVLPAGTQLGFAIIKQDTLPSFSVN